MAEHSTAIPGDGRGRQTGPWALAVLSAWSLLLVAWLTWTPFSFEGVLDPDALFPHTGPLDLLGNVALFAPMALVLIGFPLRNPVRTVALAALGGSVVVELGQLYSQARVASPVDIALNAGGAVLVAWAFLGPLRRLRTPALRVTVALVWIGTVALAVQADRTFAPGMVLEGWDPEYPVTQGDEAGAERSYVGTVSDARICAGEGDDRLCATDGAPADVRRRLTELAARDQRLEMSASVESGSDVQSGPTRIITFSRGAFLRNVTMAQESTGLVLRFRTPLTGSNGRRYEIYVPGVIHEGVPTSITSVFDEGAVRTSIETATGETVRNHVFDAFAVGILTRPGDYVPPGQQIARYVYMLLLGLPLLAGALEVGGILRRES
jgi:VanZ family protein